MDNKKYIFLRKQIPLILFTFYFFSYWNSIDYMEYTSDKKNYILVNGIIEEFDYKITVKYGRSYSIIRVDLNGYLHKVKVTKRHRDKIGQMVQIAINPSEYSGGIEEGIWTKPFLPYDSIIFVLSVGITAILYYLFKKWLKWLSKQKLSKT